MNMKEPRKQTDQHHFAAAVLVMFGDLTTQFGDTRFDLGFRDHHFNSMFHITNQMILMKISQYGCVNIQH